MSDLPDLSFMVTGLKPGWFWVQFGSPEWVAVHWTGSELYSPHHDGVADVMWVTRVGPNMQPPDEAER